MQQYRGMSEISRTFSSCVGGGNKLRGGGEGMIANPCGGEMGGVLNHKVFTYFEEIQNNTL